MNVLGELKKAQFENATPGTLSGAVATGRVYADVTTPTAAVPRFYNGLTWVPLKTGQSASLVSQNSGQSVTVNWANGLNQQVILTGHCVISFTNPQAGEKHTLIVTQRELYSGANLLTPYRFTFNMTDQDPRRGPYQPVGGTQSGQSTVFCWLYSAAIKAAYATVPAKASALSSNIAFSVALLGVEFAPDGKSFYATSSSSGFNFHHSFSDDASHPIWGNASAADTNPAVATVAMVPSPDRNVNFYAKTASPYILGYLYNATNQNLPGSVFADPGTLPTGAAQCIAVHPTGLAVVLGHTTTPFMTGYPIISQAFSTKFTNPATLPAAQVNSVAFSLQGDYLAVASQTTPFLQVYPFDPYTGYGVVLANPGTLPAGGPAGATGKGVAWRPQGDYIALAMTASPYLYVVPFNRATGTYGTPLTVTSIPAAALTSLQWTPDGQYLLTGSGTSPYLSIYDFSSALLNTTVTLDSSNPGVGVNDISVHPSGEFALLSSTSSPYIHQYPLPRKVRNYLRISE